MQNAHEEIGRVNDNRKTSARDQAMEALDAQLPSQLLAAR